MEGAIFENPNKDRKGASETQEGEAERKREPGEQLTAEELEHLKRELKRIAPDKTE